MTSYPRYVAHNGARHQIYQATNGELRIIQNPRPRYGRTFFKALTEEEAEDWEAYKARTKKVGHVGVRQICERQVGSKAGVIAHHGYQRPKFRSGWQTRSCYGARRRPWADAHDALGEWIEQVMKPQRERDVERLAELQTGTCEIRKEESKLDSLGRAVFDCETGQWETHLVTYRPGDKDYARLLGVEIARQERDVKLITEELDRQKKRLDGWKAE